MKYPNSKIKYPSQHVELRERVWKITQTSLIESVDWISRWHKIEFFHSVMRFEGIEVDNWLSVLNSAGDCKALGFGWRSMLFSSSTTHLSLSFNQNLRDEGRVILKRRDTKVLIITNKCQSVSRQMMSIMIVWESLFVFCSEPLRKSIIW